MKNIDANTIPKNSKWLTPAIFSKIDELELLPKRNSYASLVSYLKSTGAPKKTIEKSVSKMNEVASLADSVSRGQHKSVKQENNWVEWPKILQLFKSFQRDANSRSVWKRENVVNGDRELLENIMILAWHGGIEAPGRLELSNVKLLDRKTALNNRNENFIYRDRSSFIYVINRAKTTKSNGPFRKRLEPQMTRLLNKYIRAFDIKNGEHIFRTKTGRPYSQKMWSRRIQKIFRDNFGKNIGASLIRSIYLSNLHKNTPSLESMAHTAKTMQHSVMTALSQYVKK